MATINQLKNQVATCSRRIEEIKGKIEMYSSRFSKACAKMEKKFRLPAGTLNTGNFKEELNRMGASWGDVYTLENHLDYKADNEKNLAYEQRTLARLEAELKALKEKAEAKESSIAPLREKIGFLMNEFRTSWFDRMLTWYGRHYDFIQAELPKAKADYERAKALSHRISVEYRWMEHRGLRKRLENIREKLGEIIGDEAASNRYSNKREYLNAMEANLERKWNECNDILAEKCKKFKLNIDRLNSRSPRVTDKGFEVVLYDGSGKLVDARIIWAAEYSLYVCPHTRYIVTQREA